MMAIKQDLMTALLRWQVLMVLAGILAIALHLATGSAMPLLVVLAVGSVPLLWQVMRKVLHGDFGADILAIIALVTAALLQEYLAGVLIIIMLAGGQALETYAQAKASFVLRALAARMPSIAHRRQGDRVEDVPISGILVGDILEIYPHESCPVDGTVIEGHGNMDEAYLTGEPYKIAKAPGSTVLSGAINGQSVLRIRADKQPADSRYAQIMRVMQDAEQRRPALRRLGDQVGAIFTPIALIFAIAAWVMTGDPTRFLAVMVIATPCPLLIAIPVAIISAISLAARQGIIIKDPIVLERLPTVRTAIFDKTGTLTYGEPALVDIILAPGQARAQVLEYAASLERYSKHPLAGAIITAAQREGCAVLPVDAVSEKPGDGLRGRIAGRDVRISHRKKLQDTHADQIKAFPAADHGMECMVIIDGNIVAALRFFDTPRSDGKAFIAHLAPVHGLGKIMLVSGDRDSEVTYLAATLGITETYASQSPEQKLAIVRAETAKAPTLFMGDGINDAPALAAATVGLAFGQGTGVTSEAAGAVIMDSSLARVDALLHISILMRRIAVQCAVGGMALSIIGMGLAAMGYITPVMGAVLQEAIDVLAIANALRMTAARAVHTDLGR